MKTRPLCVVCLLIILLQGVIMIMKGGDSITEIPASSIFYAGKEKTLLIKGQVYKKTSNSNYQILYLKNNSVKDNRLIIHDYNFTEIPIGKYILIRGKLCHFEKARNPGEFDKSLYYARQNIFGSILCEEILDVSGDRNILMECLYQLKNLWKKSLHGCMGDKNGGILAAMILGEKSEMDLEVKELYQNNGISHILAISGLHISFIGMGIYKLIRKTGMGFCVSGILAMSILTLYVLMIGFSVSAVRAYIMLLLKIGADITGRTYDMLTAAMLGAALTVIYQPLYLTDGGFYMSYGAILGIAILLPVLEYCFPCRWKLLSGCYASIAINLMLFPIMLWFFYVFPTYSVLLNMLVLPLTGPVLGIGILGSIFVLCVPFVGEVCLKVCGCILEFYEWICRVGNQLPLSRIVLGQPEWREIILYYTVLLGIVLMVPYFIKRNAKRKWCCSTWLAIVLVALLMAYRPSGILNITMLDVGQGDGIYLRGPEGMTYFIDGGSSDASSLGKYCIEPFLESRGTGTLDYVFITHGDTDHYNGIEEMLGRQDVGVVIRNLVLPVNYRQDESLVELAKKAKEVAINVLVINEGDILKEGNMQILCLQPAKRDSDLKGNAGSMILEVRYKLFSMLFTGDVEGEGEELLLRKLKEKDYDVLKVAHHGSKYSTSEKFLELCNPEVALISAGENNSYGHPHKELLDRLEDAGCKIYNTQKKGAIIIQTDGNSLTIW